LNITYSDGVYATAVGRVIIDGNTPEINCYICRPVTNFNDITHHHLSVIAVHIDLIKKQVIAYSCIFCYII
jgi:hypothetical protein